MKTAQLSQIKAQKLEHNCCFKPQKLGLVGKQWDPRTVYPCGGGRIAEVGAVEGASWKDGSLRVECMKRGGF